MELGFKVQGLGFRVNGSRFQGVLGSMILGVGEKGSEL
jgi:hypothetical protein